MNKLLSIIIPTYNGGDYLAQNLGTLVPMMKKCDSNEVELIIANNASIDNTEEIIMNALKEYPQIIYIKRSSNIGYMNNFAESVKESHGEFVFLLGDDDVLIPGFIDIILSVIKTNPKISLIHWNRIDYVEKTGRTSLYNQCVDTNGWSIYESFFQFLKEHASMDSMSTVLFNRSCWENGGEFVKPDYYGYEWYSRILYGARNGIYAYTFFPLVIQRHPLKRKWTDLQVLYNSGLLNIYRDLDPYCPGIYDYLLNHSMMGSYSYFIAQMYVVANNKAIYKDKYDIIKQHMVTKGRRRFLYLVTFVFPKFLSNFIVFVLRVFDYIKRHSRI